MSGTFSSKHGFAYYLHNTAYEVHKLLCTICISITYLTSCFKSTKAVVKIDVQNFSFFILRKGMGIRSPVPNWSSNLLCSDNPVTLGQRKEGAGKLFTAQEDR